MALCTIYRDVDFGDEYRTFDTNDPDFRNIPNGYGGNWSDEASSIKIHSGTWELFEHIDYQGISVVLGPGNYPRLGELVIGNDTLSSIRVVAE
jgi:Beta/Gamma crystallin